MLDQIHFYSPEVTLFPDPAKRFQQNGKLTGEEIYLILDWKASRARTRHLRRLKIDKRTFSQAAHEHGLALHGAADDECRLRLVLGSPWSFALPTATAMLAVLYPYRFTVYDIRVCDALGDFHRLGHRRWSERSWADYCRFVEAVRVAAPANLSLRDADRWLWGHDKRKALRRELGLG